MRRLAYVAIPLTALMVAMRVSAADNLLLNGSFESGLTSWSLSHDYIFPFWKRQWDYGGENLYPRNYNYGNGVYMTFEAHQGSRFVNLQSVSLYQIVNVVPDQEYLLSFFVGSFDDGTYPPTVTGWGGVDLAVIQGHSLATAASPLFAGYQVIPPEVQVTWNQYNNYTPGDHFVNWVPFSYSFTSSADQAAFIFQGGVYTFSLY